MGSHCRQDVKITRMPVVVGRYMVADARSLNDARLRAEWAAGTRGLELLRADWHQWKARLAYVDSLPLVQ